MDLPQYCYDEIGYYIFSANVVINANLKTTSVPGGGLSGNLFVSPSTPSGGGSYSMPLAKDTEFKFILTDASNNPLPGGNTWNSTSPDSYEFEQELTGLPLGTNVEILVSKTHKGANIYDKNSISINFETCPEAISRPAGYPSNKFSITSSSLCATGIYKATLSVGLTEAFQEELFKYFATIETTLNNQPTTNQRILTPLDGAENVFTATGKPPTT